MVELDFSILQKLRPYRPSKVGRQVTNVIGRKFTRLTPLGLLGLKIGGGGACWLCRCDCSVFRIIPTDKLLGERAKSCGCYLNSIRGNANRTHGESRSKLHCLWGDLNNRCRNPKNTSYIDYGARGITVCNRWRKYENFRDDILSSIGMPPTPKHTIDRIDNDKGYEPDNVRWATHAEQRRNTRHIINLTVNGETHCVVDWGKIVGLNYSVITRRIKRGWSLEEALNFKERVKPIKSTS